MCGKVSSNPDVISEKQNFCWKGKKFLFCCCCWVIYLFMVDCCFLFVMKVTRKITRKVLQPRDQRENRALQHKAKTRKAQDRRNLLLFSALCIFLSACMWCVWHGAVGGFEKQASCFLRFLVCASVHMCGGERKGKSCSISI